MREHNRKPGNLGRWVTRGTLEHRLASVAALVKFASSSGDYTGGDPRILRGVPIVRGQLIERLRLKAEAREVARKEREGRGHSRSIRHPLANIFP